MSKYIKKIRSIDLNPSFFKVKRLKKFPKDWEDAEGWIDPSKEVIYIKSHLSVNSDKLALFHEVLHGILFKGGIPVHNNTIEKLIEIFSYGLITFFKSNIKFLEYLLGDNENECRVIFTKRIKGKEGNKNK